VEGVRRHDYLPFGEENVYNAVGGSRTAANGYLLNDGVRQQFGSKERDTETGLDFFEVRYFSSGQGRFASTDPLMESARSSNPQSWNRYSYVLNRPLSLIDPSGMEDEDPQSGRKKDQEQTIQIKTIDGPKNVSVKVKQIDKVPKTGELPVGGEFEITVKFTINNPTDGTKPEDYSQIKPIGGLVDPNSGTFTNANGLGTVGETKVKVDPKTDGVEVEKTDRFVLNKGPNGDTGAINFKVVVTDPVNVDRAGNPKTVQIRTVNMPTVFDKSPSYIPVRSV
jgi:RHS repeat-associated protein